MPPSRFREPVRLPRNIALPALAVQFDGLTAPELTFARPRHLAWHRAEMDLTDAELVLDEDQLVLRVIAVDAPVPEAIEKMDGVLNERAVVLLADGTEVAADFAHLRRRTTSLNVGVGMRSVAEIELDNWVWSGAAVPAVWLGHVEGAKLRGGNLVLNGAGGHLRVKGSYAWHVLGPKKGPHRVLLDVGDVIPDRDRLVADFLALSFALGQTMSLETLVGLDAKFEPVAALGLGFGFGRQIGRGRCPVPNFHHLEGCWPAGLVPKLTSKMDQAGRMPLMLGLAAYMDSLVGHLDGSYLAAQIGLEAFCHEIATTRPSVLVADTKTWIEWVTQHRAEIEKHGVDATAATKLVRKVQSAMHAPSGEIVEAALKEYGARVPQQALQEVARRGRSAHRYLMSKDDHEDLQGDVDRKTIIQTLITALVAKYVGYEGPICGWERGPGGYELNPQWWTCSGCPEAAQRYVCERD